MIEQLAFATLLLVFAVPLGVAFGPDDLAAVRSWWVRSRARHRIHHRAAIAWRNGVDLDRWFAQLARTKPNPRIRTLPRHRLNGGRA